MNVSFVLWDMDEIIMWSLLSNMHLLLLRTRLKKKKWEITMKDIEVECLHL